MITDRESMLNQLGSVRVQSTFIPAKTQLGFSQVQSWVTSGSVKVQSKFSPGLRQAQNLAMTVVTVL